MNVNSRGAGDSEFAAAGDVVMSDHADISGEMGFKGDSKKDGDRHS